MEAVSDTAGASLRKTIEWHKIIWRKVCRNVRRLRVRIVKATQEGNNRRARALQIIPTRSFGGKALAVRRVTENKGRRTPGIDGEIRNSPKKKTEGIQSPRRTGYKALPLRRIYIPKSNGKQRPLGIPTMRDRAVRALHKLVPEPVAETTADRNSYGFRPGRSTADAIGQVFTCLSQKVSATWILEADIRSCSDKISHKWPEDNIPMDKAVPKQWLKAGFMEKGIFHDTGEGTPQGGIISPVLANMAPDGLERKLKKEFIKSEKVSLVRYADDFIITGATEKLLEERVRPVVPNHMAERGLSLSEEKTKITHIRDGFDFLGQNVRKLGKDKLIIRPSGKNFKKFLNKTLKIIRDNTHTHPLRLIRKSNPVIRGWAEYHKHVVSKVAFGRADYEITRAIMGWAGRRHPKKSGKWIKHKYFRVSEQGRDWCFFGRKNGSEAYLFHAMNVPIKRHVKIKGNTNPFDPEHEICLEKRRDRKTREDIRKRGKVCHPWKEQDGRCPVCGEPITEESVWHNHHIKWKIYGGSDASENRILMHPNCHRQVHSPKSEVGKLRPQKGRQKGLSRMWGNSQIRFLGDLGMVTSPGYPTIAN